MSEWDICTNNPAVHGMGLLQEQFPTKASYAVRLHAQLTSLRKWLSQRKLLNIQAGFCSFQFSSSCEAVIYFVFSSVAFHSGISSVKMQTLEMPSQAEKESVLPHAQSSVVAKHLGYSTWAWPLSPATASNFSSLLAYSTCHVLMMLPNPFLNLLVLPAPTTSSAQRGFGLTSQCLYWMSSPAVVGLCKQQLCFPFPTAAPPAQAREHIPTTPIFSSLGPCPELHQQPAPSFSCGNSSWECPLWEISPRASQFAPFSEDDKFL